MNLVIANKYYQRTFKENFLNFFERKNIHSYYIHYNYYWRQKVHSCFSFYCEGNFKIKKYLQIFSYLMFLSLKI